jgi:hypothetical protein
MKFLCALLALVMATPAMAQDAGAKKAYEALVKEYEATMAAYSAKMSEIADSDEYKAARKNNDWDTARALRAKVSPPDRKAWAGRFLEGAKPFAGTDGAVPFLSWAVRMGQGDVQSKAFDTLFAEHAGSAALEEFSESLAYVGRAVGEKKARWFADALIAENDNPVIKANAHYARAMMLRPGRGEKISEADQALMDAHLAKVVEIAPDSIVALKAAAPEFERTRLQIGMVAPDIVGNDTSGQEFKLSDYRGKVVVLDFWGDW